MAYIIASLVFLLHNVEYLAFFLLQTTLAISYIENLLIDCIYSLFNAYLYQNTCYVWSEHLVRR